MKNILIATCMTVAAFMFAGPVTANDELLVMEKNPADWVSPTGNYANHRYSELIAD